MTGVAKVGRSLKASPGTWTPSPRLVRYQWLRDGAPIKGATEKTYCPKKRDLGARISVRVTVSATAYDDATATSQPTDKVERARR